MEIRDALKTAYDALDSKKAEDIKALDISEISIIADYFLIATGKNVNHVKTLAEAVEEKLAQNGFSLRHREGFNTAAWILLDFGSIIVHIFGEEERAFYNLEHIWGDAKEVIF